MNESPEDAWFYTQEGERLGPVTLSDLRVKVREAGLNPRLDMVWTQGMAEWKPAGEIEGLFERRNAPEPKESLAPSADPYKPPAQQSAADKMGREGGWPGARRRSFLIAAILFPVVWNLLLPPGLSLLAGQLGPEIVGLIMIGAVFVPVVVAVYYGIQRLANLGMSRWWYLGNFVPFLNLWVGYRTFACPAGYAYHKKLDGPGVALAILYWLIMAIAILAVVAAIALLFGAIDNPEIEGKLREAIRVAQEQGMRK